MNPPIVTNIIEKSYRINLINQSISDISELQQEHYLTTPNITSPTKGEVITGPVRIEWTEAIDSQGYKVTYTVKYAQTDRVKWRVLKENISKTYYIWDTSQADWTDYYILIKAESSAGLESEDTEGPITIRNWLNPPIRIFLTLFLLIMILVIIIGARFRRKQISSSAGTFNGLDDPKILRFGLCLGSFTDEGLVIKGTNDKCHFSHYQMQSMLEYSAILFQEGKTEIMYGPIPLTNLRENGKVLDPSQPEWNFISYWMNVKDSMVKDSRITKIGGEVSAALLLFYPKQFDHMVLINKNRIINIIKSLINSDTDISNFTNDTLNFMETELLKLFIK